MPRATMKHLGGKKPSKTRKNRKPLKKNKRKNIKKGGDFKWMLGENPLDQPHQKVTRRKKHSDAKNLLDKFNGKHLFTSDNTEINGTSPQFRLALNCFKDPNVTGFCTTRANGAFDNLYNTIKPYMNDNEFPENEVIAMERGFVNSLKFKIKKEDLTKIWKDLHN